MARPERQQRSGKYLGNHQRSWIWGRHAVAESLKRTDWPVVTVVVDESHPEEASRDVCQSALDRGIAVEFQPRSRLQSIVPNADHQGFAARMGEFPYDDLDAMAGNLTQRLAVTSGTAPIPNQQPLVVMLDHIQDAYNFGAILRCCDAFAADFVVIPDRYQAGVSSQVVRSSAGSAAHLRIARVDDPELAAGTLEHCGLVVAAATERGSSSTFDCAELKQPLLLIIGSEAVGVQPALLKRATLKLAIPQSGGVSSLNAAVAAGILLHEIRRQQAASD